MSNRKFKDGEIVRCLFYDELCKVIDYESEFDTPYIVEFLLESNIPYYRRQSELRKLIKCPDYLT